MIFLLHKTQMRCIKSFFQEQNFSVYLMSPSVVRLCRDNAIIHLEVITDKNWISEEYPLRELLIQRKDVRRTSHWICVMNLNKTQFYIIPTPLLLSAQLIWDYKNQLVYSLDPAVAQYSYGKGVPYFKA
jgi:hypothetical protein